MKKPKVHLHRGLWWVDSEISYGMGYTIREAWYHYLHNIRLFQLYGHDEDHAPS